METANKDAALQCLEKAKKALKEGRTEVAERLASKSFKLCPTEEAKEFLNNLKKSGRAEAPSSPKQAPRARQREASRERKEEKEEPKQEREYTTEQENAVKRVLRCDDYYEILEVSKTASEVDIKKQYKRLALQLHPDKNSAPKADDAFKAVSKAYAVLSDKEKKNNYDRFGEDGLRGSNAYQEQDVDADHIFRMFFGGDIFGNGFGGGGGYTVYEDVFGRRIYRRNNHSRFTHSHGAHTHTHRQPESGLAMFLQLVPIIILLIVVLSSNFLSFSPLAVYSFQQSNTYPIKRYVKDLHIPYFVQRSFTEEYVSKPNRLASIEREVTSDYMWNLQHQCQNDKYLRRRRGKSENPESCQKLEKLRNKQASLRS